LIAAVNLACTRHAQRSEIRESLLGPLLETLRDRA